jgi:GNAT superfamily N-acetyltransferase
MGSYYGVRSGARSDGELIAMGGERLSLDGYPEISGVCTHPAHRGKGLAANLIRQLVRDHRRDGLVSWLHVGNENHRASNSTFEWGSRRSARSLSIGSRARVEGEDYRGLNY